MQYKIKQSTKNFKLLSEDELIEDLLKARGVEDVQAFLNVNKNCVHDGMLLKNMEKGLKCLEKHIKIIVKYIVYAIAMWTAPLVVLSCIYTLKK